MTREYFWCKQCLKTFKTEELVKVHLQWKHNIPPFEAIQQLDYIKKYYLNDSVNLKR